MRANIYSIDPLTSVERQPIMDGIGMVAANLGQEIASREIAIKLPVNESGIVRPERVGLTKLDRMVELHLFAVPLDKDNRGRLGWAGVGRGWSFVDTSSQSTSIIRTTTAHEVSHAFGFVSKNVEQSDSDSPCHCRSGNCIMHQSVTTIEMQREVEADVAVNWFKRKFGKGKTEIEYIDEVYGQYDFCSPCKTDMWSNGDKNIRALRYDRVMVAKEVK